MPAVMSCPGARGRMHPPDGCRCLVDAAPTRHLVTQMIAVGWPLDEQGRRLGLRHGRNFAAVLRRTRIERATALAVAALHERLWDIPGPSPRTVTTAIRRGYTAPDPVTVARLVDGRRCAYTTADRDQAIRVLAARGLSANAIATRLHAAHRDVRAVTTTTAA